MFALAENYGILKLRSTAYGRFARSFLDDDEENCTPGATTRISTEVAKETETVVEEVYQSTSTYATELRYVVLQYVIQCAESDRIFDREAMRTALEDVPGFATDLAMADRRDAYSACRGCGDERPLMLGLCACGKVGICQSEECKDKWVKGSLCQSCYAAGTMSYPVLCSNDE